jgi:hypothetical protein
MTPSHCRHYSFAILAMLMLTGCPPHPQAAPPLAVPTTLFDAGYFWGSPLSGPTASPTTGPATGPIPAATPSDSLSVQVTFIALENVPATNYPPVGSRAVFVSSTGAGNAVLPAAELTRPATIADLKSADGLAADLTNGHAGRTTPMHRFTAALPPGVTATFAALDPVQLMDLVTGQPTRRSLQVMVSRPAVPAGRPQIALVLKDVLRLKKDRLDLRTELALFDLPPGDPTHTAMIVPFHFDDAQSKAVAVMVEISPGNAETAHVAATADCLKQLAAPAATQPAPATGEANPWSTVTAAVQSLTGVAGRRSSLAFLADQTGASLCEDLAMEADDAVLTQLVKNIQAKVAAHSLPTNDSNVGWLLDHTALELLAKISNDAANGTTPMPAELTSVLTTHTGEVGRHPSSLDDVLRGLSTRAELDNRLLAQNLIFLEDSSPASRVRAFDWLNSRHHAPAGYDPLGPVKARREAIERSGGQ